MEDQEQEQPKIMEETLMWSCQTCSVANFTSNDNCLVCGNSRINSGVYYEVHSSKVSKILINDDLNNTQIHDRLKLDVRRDDFDNDDADDDQEEFTPYTGYYRDGNGDSVFAFKGAEKDFTACDIDCGYCGRCDY